MNFSVTDLIVPIVIIIVVVVLLYFIYRKVSSMGKDLYLKIDTLNTLLMTPEEVKSIVSIEVDQSLKKQAVDTSQKNKNSEKPPLTTQTKPPTLLQQRSYPLSNIATLRIPPVKSNNIEQPQKPRAAAVESPASSHSLKKQQAFVQESIIKTTGPVAKTTNYAANDTGPVENTTDPVEITTDPAENTTNPSAKTTGPATKTTGPAVKKTGPELQLLSTEMDEDQAADATDATIGMVMDDVSVLNLAINSDKPKDSGLATQFVEEIGIGIGEAVIDDPRERKSFSSMFFASPGIGKYKQNKSTLVFEEIID